VLKAHPYEIVRDDGSKIKSITDDLGRTTVQKNNDIESVVIRVLRKIFKASHERSSNANPITVRQKGHIGVAHDSHAIKRYQR
jgi:hypothetical protein